LYSKEKETKIIKWEQEFFVYYGLVFAVKSVELVSDTVSCIGLRGSWCKIIILIAHAQTEEKSDDSNTVFARN
jgi:hypothetical protein